MIQHGRDFSLLTASHKAIRAQRTMYQALSGAYDDSSRDGFRRDEDGCMLNSLAICGVVPYITEWKGRSEASEWIEKQRVELERLLKNPAESR